MDKILKLLEIAKKFGVKPSKVIGTQGNIVPLKKPSLVEVNVDEFKLKESIDSGAITMDKVQQEIEETVKLALSKNLNDVELNRALNNAVNIERQFFPPVADVVKFGSGEEIKGKGLEQLIKKQGTKNPPTTVAGQLETQGKKLEKAGEDLKEITEPKSVIGDIIKDYGDFDKYMQSSEKTGYVRATVRQIMREDIQAGKLKLPKELQDQVMQGIGEPIDVYRKVYGEGALEQIDSLADDLGQFRTEEEAAKFARSKYQIEPKVKPVDESKTYEELEDMLKKGSDEPEGKAQGGIIGYALGGRTGYAEGTPMAGLVYVGSWEGPWTGPEFLGGPRKGQYYNSSKNSLTAITGPDGAIPRPGMPITTIQSPQQSETISTSEIPLTVQERYKKYLSAAGSETGDELYKSYRANLDKKADGGRIGFASGKSKAVLDLIAKANKKLKGKKSMESVNPKTGEVTVPKEPVKTAEEPTGITVMNKEPIARTTQDIEKEIDELATTPITTLEGQRKYNELHSEFINSLDPRKQKKALDYRRNSLDTENRLILKAEEQGLDFDTFEKLRTGLYGPRKQQTLNYIKTGKVNVEPVKPTTTFEEVQKRYRTAAKAADEIFPNYDNPKTAASELANVMAEQKYGKVFDDMSGDKQTELYSEAYDYITSVNRLDKVSPPNRIAPPGQEFNISDPKTAEAFTNFARENDPEGFKKIQKIVDDINNKNALEEFDPTGRKPNAKGGPAGGLDYLMGF